jgi:HK97 family phage prohead protease
METKQNKKRLIRDGVLLGDWQEVSGLPLSSVTKKDTDTATLDGLIIKGYETKFNVTNENGERYAPNCLDKFVQQYFVDHELNMVVDLQHGWDIDSQIGRVIYLEVNTVGFYFVAYVPRSVARYEQVKALLREGILQGFSKMGWATDYEYRYTRDGDLDYVEIKEFQLCSVSLVTMPANAIPFEAIGEPVKDGLLFVNRLTEEQPKPKKKSIYNNNPPIY